MPVLSMCFRNPLAGMWGSFLRFFRKKTFLQEKRIVLIFAAKKSCN
jgi:hypothetical protein